MEGSTIHKIINCYNVSYFRGICTIGTIPEDLGEGEFVIFNLSNSPPGTHWAYIFCREIIESTNVRHLEIFDSLGVDESVYEEYQIPGNYYIYNTDQLQPTGSKSCGLFCIYFAVLQYENLDLDFFDILNVAFVEDRFANEEKVIRFAEQNGCGTASGKH